MLRACVLIFNSLKCIKTRQKAQKMWICSRYFALELFAAKIWV